MLTMNPCKDDDLACLNKVLETVGPAIELANACKDCGWDTQAFIDQLLAQKDMATKAKAKFFSDRS